MSPRWMVIPVMSLLVLPACLGVESPPETEPVPTITSTPLLDPDEIAHQTEVAAWTDTPTILPTAAETRPPLTLTPGAATVTPQPYPPPGSESIGSPAVGVTGETFDRYFVVQSGSPVPMANWVHPEAGCDWMGVAGQVFDLQARPVVNVVVEAGGTLGAEPLLGLALTGQASAYGPAGYEIQLAERTIPSQGEIWVQLKDGAGELLSSRIYFDTFDDCSQNLILLNFVETAEVPTPLPSNEVYFPVIVHQEPD